MSTTSANSTSRDAMSICDVIERAAQRSEWWSDRWEAAAAAAARLVHQGVEYDDRVAFREAHSEDVVSALIACWMIGAIPAMIDPRGDPTFFRQDADPKLDIENLEELVSEGTPYRGPTPDGAAGLFLSWTSGTTGQPKGAVIDSGPVTLATACIAERLRLRKDDVVICSNPLASSFQLVAALLPAAHAACRFVPAEGLSVDELWRAVRKEAGTVFVGYPLTLAEFVSSQYASTNTDLRLTVSGGSPLAPRLKREFRAELGVPMCESYGQSELGGFVALGDPMDDDERFVTHVGRALPDRPAWTEPAGEGEIVVLGPGMRGYRGLPKETAEVLAPPGVRTGDVGTHDDDGYIRVLGRRSDQLPDGRWPRDLEDALYDHPDVLHAAIINTGANVVAVVEGRKGRTLDAQELARSVAVDECQIRDAIPRTFSGKVDKIRMSREMRAT